MAALILLLSIPLMILNMLGGIVGGIGLAVQGQWALLFGGVFWCVAGAFILSIAMMPGMIFAPLGIWANNRGHPVLAIVAGLPSLAWTYVVLIVSSLVVFHGTIARPESGLFHLLWAYCLTTAPWSYLASKDRQGGNEYATMLMFFVQLGTVAMMYGSWNDPSNAKIDQLSGYFLPFMGLGFLAQLFVLWVETQARRHRPY